MRMLLNDEKMKDISNYSILSLKFLRVINFILIV